MKRAPDGGPIWSAWLNGGALAGSVAPHGRVTVEPGYSLHTQSPAGTFMWPPARWYQRADNSQAEVEIPGVEKIEHEYSVDNDAGTATITIRNFKEPVYGVGDPTSTDFGQPGYLTFDRGSATNRWGYTPNEWAGVLGVNALIRTYEGYGGHGLTIPQAILAGNLVLTGVWLVDQPDISTDGTLILNCRSMAKLLVDQQVFPPLVPPALYPISWSAAGTTETTSAVEIYGHTTGVPIFAILPGPGRCIMGIATNSTDDGYWMVGTDGAVYNFGNTHFYGCPVGLFAPLEFATGIASTFDDLGYWVVTNLGHVYAYGNAQWDGNPDSTHWIVDIACMGPGAPDSGYVCVSDHGEVYAFSSATYYGGGPGGTNIVGISPTPTGTGYWLLDSAGAVYSYGGASYHGGSSGPHPFTGISTTETGLGYYLTTTHGEVYTFGDAVFYGAASGISLNDPVSGIVIARNGTGYWLVAQDGGVFTYAATVRTQGTTIIYAIQFYGSLPGAFTYFFPGNYDEFVHIVKPFLLWAGFYLYDGGATGSVYGNIESTGTHSTDILDASIFDKKPVIDAINYIKAIVGYLFYVGDEGEAHFHEPNFWQSGNVLRDSSRTSYIPVIDERVQLTVYKRSNPDADIRSEIIVSSEDPYPDTGGGAPPGTVTTSFVPAQASLLKGMIVPAMWINEGFAGTLPTQPPDPVNAAIENIIAQLIALHIYFKSQLGTLTMAANPMLGIDDQVQILERQSFEINIHYIRTIHSTFDLLTGEYTMDLTTNILSPPGAWMVTKPSGAASGTSIVARV